MSDLAGILVVSVEHAVAAPMASCKLADAGARVIKVERKEGDFARHYDRYAKGESAYFVWLNRGKQSVALDLRDEKERRIFTNMVRRADVLIENLAPGAMRRLSFDYERLAHENPGLIYCSISGYGSFDESAKKAYDMLIQAESGLSAITGNAHGPARVGVSICDITTGLNAAQLITQALIGRAKTGRGRHIDVSLYHTMSDFMNVPFLQYQYGGKSSEPSGLRHPSIAPYGSFETKDGAMIVMAIQSDGEWGVFCDKILGRPELAKESAFATNQARVENREAVDGLCAGFIGAHDLAEVTHAFDAHRIAYGHVSELADIISHPATKLAEINTPSGPLEIIAPVAPDAGARQELGEVPAFDQHGDEIRAEFGD